LSFQHLKELTVHDTCYGPYTVQGIFNLKQFASKNMADARWAWYC